MTFPYCINVDWLQVFCLDENPESLTVHNIKQDYEFILQPHSSRHFKEIWRVVNSDGDDYAVIQRRPFSSIITKEGAIVQLCNRELYKPHMSATFSMFLRLHGFKYKSISRIDLCFDSNVLAGGLLHANLIKGLMSEAYLKNNQAKVKWHFDAMANVGRPMECNSASFGSKSSPVSTKIYNKTLELSEVKNKPYIVECWGFNGLDTSKDVWRIEISIKSEATTALHTSSGEILRLSPSMVEFQDDIEDIFFSYAKRYFAFKVNDGKKNKTRMADLPIFPTERSRTIRPLRITNERDATRSDRVFLKKLHGLFKELTNLDSRTEAAIWEVSNAFVLNKSLSTWRQSKLLTDNDGLPFPRGSKIDLEARIMTIGDDICRLFPHKSDKVESRINLVLQLLKDDL